MLWELSAETLAADLPGYEILNPTGHGAMGRVFVARQTALERLVCDQIPADQRRGRPRGAIWPDSAARRRSPPRCRIPTCSRVFDFGEVEGRPYLVMEYVPDGDLRRRMPPSEPMPLAEIVAILEPIGRALTYLHGEGVLHRDLKPENILMQGPVPKVADFGIAVERTGSGGTHAVGPGARDARVRRARAAVPPARGRAGRPVLAGRHDLRDAHRAASARRLQAPLAPQREGRPGDRPRGAPRPGRGPRAPLRLGPGVRRGPRAGDPGSGAAHERRVGLGVGGGGRAGGVRGWRGWTAWLRAHAAESAPPLVEVPPPAILPVWPEVRAEGFQDAHRPPRRGDLAIAGEPGGKRRRRSPRRQLVSRRSARSGPSSSPPRRRSGARRPGGVRHPTPTEVARVWKEAHKKLLKETAKPPQPPEAP